MQGSKCNLFEAYISPVQRPYVKIFKHSFCVCACVYTSLLHGKSGVVFRNWNCLMVANNKKYRPSMYNR